MENSRTIGGGFDGAKMQISLLMGFSEKGELEIFAKEAKIQPINSPPLCTVFGLKNQKNQPNYGQISPQNPTKRIQERTRKIIPNPRI